MPKAKAQKELSTEANIGKILILVGIALQALGIAASFTLGSLWMGGMMGWMMGGLWSGMFGGFWLLVGLVQIAGLVAGIYAYKAAQENDFRNAGTLAIVSSLLPPLQLIMLAGGILCMVSREAKK